MRFALALGRRNLGRTWPNPSVGAVVVRDRGGRAPVILGAAATAPGGRPHGEPLALAQAGEAARGATLYVSLEPCSHHGRTPPCADAIVEAGIARVVSALEDPDGRVAGRGHARLRAAGIAVSTGPCAHEAARDHRGHVMRVRRGRPFITLKLARTPDGYAGVAGSRLMITGDGANARMHLLRAENDAVGVGIGTALADDPRLDVRLPGFGGHSPLAVVFDTHLRLPPESRLVLSAAVRPLWVVCGSSASVAAEARLTGSGVIVLRIPAGPDRRLDLAAAMGMLGARGLTRLLCEGGPEFADALAKAGLIDSCVLLTGAVPLGRSGTAAVGPALTARLRELSHLDSERVGPDLIQTYEEEPCSPGS